VDSNDVWQIDDARNELQKLLEEDKLSDEIVLVDAHKQDFQSPTKDGSLRNSKQDSDGINEISSISAQTDGV
jgi:hypothetical protein